MRPKRAGRRASLPRLRRGLYLGEKAVEVAVDGRRAGNFAVSRQRSAHGETARSFEVQRDLAFADAAAHIDRAAVERIGPNGIGTVRAADDAVVELELQRARIRDALPPERRLIGGDVGRLPDASVLDGRERRTGASVRTGARRARRSVLSRSQVSVSGRIIFSQSSRPMRSVSSSSAASGCFTMCSRAQRSCWCVST